MNNKEKINDLKHELYAIWCKDRVPKIEFNNIHYKINNFRNNAVKDDDYLNLCEYDYELNWIVKNPTKSGEYRRILVKKLYDKINSNYQIKNK